MAKTIEDDPIYIEQEGDDDDDDTGGNFDEPSTIEEVAEPHAIVKDETSSEGQGKVDSITAVEREDLSQTRRSLATPSATGGVHERRARIRLATERIKITSKLNVTLLERLNTVAADGVQVRTD